MNRRAFWNLRAWDGRRDGAAQDGPARPPEESERVCRSHSSVSPCSCPQLQQVAEEKAGVAAQLRAVSQTLRDSQQRCHWLEGRLQLQGPAHSQVSVPTPNPPTLPQSGKPPTLPAVEHHGGCSSSPPVFHHQGSVCAEVAPGAPQEKNDDLPDSTAVSQLRER